VGIRTENLPPVQRASKVLLGSAYRLEIGALISEWGSRPINPTELKQKLEGLSEDPPAYSSVAQELEKLAAYGLINPVKSTVREAYFERQDSVFFEMCRRLRDEVKEAASPRRARVGESEEALK
jgi:hypothetical protein